MVMVNRIKNPMTDDREHSDQMTAKHNDAKQMTNDYFYSNRQPVPITKTKKTIHGIAY